MSNDDAKDVLAAQDQAVRDLIRGDVNHGVLIPLKTTLELGGDYVSGRILITRTPVKSANTLLGYVYNTHDLTPRFRMAECDLLSTLLPFRNHHLKL